MPGFDLLWFALEITAYLMFLYLMDRPWAWAPGRFLLTTYQDVADSIDRYTESLERRISLQEKIREDLEKSWWRRFLWWV